MPALASLSTPQIQKLKPQAETYFEDLSKKLSILISSPIKPESFKFLIGDFSSFFEAYKRPYMLSKMSWDGKEGKILLFNSMQLSIIFSSAMMGIPTAAIEQKIKTMLFDDEIAEAYKEVSNQLWGGINQILIAKIDKNIHLTLHSTDKIPEDGSGNASLVEATRYLIISLGMRVQGFEPFPLFLFLTENLASTIFGITLEEESLDTQTRIDPKIIDVIATILLAQVMNPNHPTIEISKTLGEAYQLMQKSKVDSLPIIENGKVVRVITRNNLEIIRSVFFDAPGQKERQKKIESMPLIKICPDQKLISGKTSDLLKTVVQKMTTAQINSLPILDEKESFVGMLTSLGILKVLYN